MSLTAVRCFVLDGHNADRLIVVARSHGEPRDTEGLSLFLVDGNAPGVTRTRTIMADSRNAANIQLSNVTVTASKRPRRGRRGVERTGASAGPWPSRAGGRDDGVRTGIL